MAIQTSVTPSYEVWLCSQTGERYVDLKPILSSGRVTLVQNGHHVAVMQFPSDGFNYDYIAEDGRIEIWRGSNEADKVLLADTIFMLVRDQRQAVGGSTVTTLTAWGAARVFDWPIVAYDAASAYSAKTDYADDMIKAIARENVGNLATDTNRDMSAYLGVQADTSSAPSISKSFARRRLSDVFNEICEAAAANGTRLYWDVVQTAAGLELRTYTGQRGTNRGLTAVDQLIFAEGRGLEDIEYQVDWSNSVSRASGLGQGTEASRNIQTATDADRIAASIWGYIKEGTKNANQATSDAGVLAEADSVLRDRRPIRLTSGRIRNTPAAQFGVHWFHGDRVVVEVFGQQFDVIISPITIDIAKNGENIDARLRVEA